MQTLKIKMFKLRVVNDHVLFTASIRNSGHKTWHLRLLALYHDKHVQSFISHDPQSSAAESWMWSFNDLSFILEHATETVLLKYKVMFKCLIGVRVASQYFPRCICTWHKKCDHCFTQFTMKIVLFYAKPGCIFEEIETCLKCIQDAPWTCLNIALCLSCTIHISSTYMYALNNFRY